MAGVVKNANDTYTLTLSAFEQKTLKRRADEHDRAKAEHLDVVITQEIGNWATHYRNADLPTLRERYEAAGVDVQSQVDTLLGLE